MRLLCVLNGGPDHPSTRFRVLQHLDTLRARGIQPDILVAKRREGYDVLDLRRRAAQADAILIQKKLLARWKLRLLPRGASILFDFDDALFEVSPDEEERFGPARAERRAHSRRRRLGAVLRRARRVVAGNRFLATYARRTAARVTVLPTGVDLGAFPEERVREAARRRRERSGQARIGWIGSRPSLRYLNRLAGPLREACARVSGARLVQISNAFADLPGVPTEKRAWRADSEADDLLDLDLGLMPIDGRPYARGKCGLKILQYQAAGVPVVCSPVGANLEIVQPGTTGLVAKTDRQWVQAMVRLLTEPDLARRLGEAGRARVVARYAAPRLGERLAALILSCGGPLPDEESEGQDQPGQDDGLLVADHLAERPARLAPGKGPE